MLTGIDVLARDGFKLLAGRRVGLVTNHTGTYDLDTLLPRMRATLEDGMGLRWVRIRLLPIGRR